jgi:hypothetical protein
MCIQMVFGNSTRSDPPAMRATQRNGPSFQRGHGQAPARSRVTMLPPLPQLNVVVRLPAALSKLSPDDESSLSRAIVCAAVFSLGLLVGAGIAVWVVPPS